MNKKILWITRTALFTALLIAMQAVTAPLGNTLITGSIVNLILAVSVITCGLASGFTVSAISPVCAKIFGIGPHWLLIPFIIAGNIVLIVIWHYLGGKNADKKSLSYIPTVVIAAAAKFAVLYVGVVLIAVPLILQLPQPQASVVSGIFSIPQLFTALIGGAIAAVILPVLEKAVAKSA